VSKNESAGGVLGLTYDGLRIRAFTVIKAGAILPQAALISIIVVLSTKLTYLT
jgi:hypothetical protein